MHDLKKLVAVGLLMSSPAWAGEVTGNGGQTPIGEATPLDPHAASICSFSGRNPEGDGANPRVQSYGQVRAQLARLLGAPVGFNGIPGAECNGHTGEFS